MSRLETVPHPARAARRLYAFKDSARFARALARTIGTQVAAVHVHRFPDRETIVRIPAPASREAILVRPLDDPDRKLVETILAADALRRAGARRVTLLAPYLPYMRQDTVFHPGEPLSQRVIGKVLGASFDRVLTLEAHLHRIARLSQVISGDSRSLSAAPAIAAWIGRAGRRGLVVGPDAESRRLAGEVARATGSQYAAGIKQRLSDRVVRVKFARLPRASRATVVDDIASSGATIAATVRALRAGGVRRVEVAVVHALFAPAALARIRAAGASRIVSCDTIAHPTNAIRTVAVFARALGGSQ